MHEHALSSRAIGFGASLLLTLTSFLIILFPEKFLLEAEGAVAAILSLALVQAIVQSIFFLNIFGEKGPRWNLVVYASTLTIIFIIIFFSIWIMNHLYYRMMP